MMIEDTLMADESQISAFDDLMAQSIAQYIRNNPIVQAAILELVAPTQEDVERVKEAMRLLQGKD